MMTKTLDHKEISDTRKHQITTNNIAQENMSFQLTSSCSCPQCNSIECFKIRNENANLLCTCHNCKDTFSIKKVLRKKSGDGCDREVITKFNEDYKENSLNVNTNRNYDKKGEENETDVKEHEQKKNTLDTKSCLSSYKADDERFGKESHNANNKSNISEDHRCYEITKQVVKKDERNDTLYTKSDSDNKNIDDHCCHKGNKETVKDIEKNQDEKQEDELKDQLHTNLSNGSIEKKFVKNCFKATKNDHKNQSQKDTLNKHIKYDLSVTKLVNKSCCEKVMTRHRKVLHDKEDALKAFSNTDLSHEKLNEKNYRDISKKVIEEYEQKDSLDKQIKSNNSEVNLHECTKLSYKDTTFIKDKIRKNERSYEKSYTRNYSVAMNYTRNKEKTESENPAATLSAQIMNLPCQDFKDSLSSQRTACSLNTNKIITTQDIFTKLKEVYKACSCKVCECIAGFSSNDGFTNDNCGCEYTEQTNTNNRQSDSSQSLRDCNQLAPSGCPCYRCDRKDCRGVWKNKMETADCDCKPCDCVKISKSFTRKCDCEPCQCAECTPLNFHVPRSVIVAPVQGNFQQNQCQCEPCECVQCTHNYGAMASSLMREVSTGMMSHWNCNCESCANNSCQFDGVVCRCNTQNRIMRKPIDRSVRDYDLRRALIEENSFNQKLSGKFNNCDTIAMFAFSNNYSNTLFNKFGDDCHCMNCECIICKEKEISGNPIKDSYEDFPLALSNISNQACKFKDCKCQAWLKDKEFVGDTIKAYRAVNDCSCDICDCLACKGLLFSSQDNKINRFSKLHLKNKTPESLTENCNSFCHKDTKDFVYPLRKGKLLTPTMFEAKILSYPQSQSVIHTRKRAAPNMLISKFDENKFNNTLLYSHNLTISHSKSVNKYFGSDNNYNQSSYTNLLSTYYLNDSNINTVPKDVGNKSLKNNESKGFIFALPCKSSTNHLENPMHKVINCNQRHMEAKTNEIKNLIDYQSSKVKINGDEDLFYNRIISFEKSISQLQEDISQNLKTLAEIHSINELSHENFSESNVDYVLSDIIPEKSRSNMDETSIINPVKFIYEEPDKTEKSENTKLENYKEPIVDGTANNYNDINNNKNDNFSKGDNKMYSQGMKKSKGNCNKLRKCLARSKVKKLSLHSENIISDFISDHLKENYRQHAKRKILNLNFSCTKSASTSYENCAVPERLKIYNDKQYSQTDIYQDDDKLWSILKKNLYINNTAVTHTGICTIPELELNIKRAVQSVSLQTNETRGYAALTNIHAEVSKLLKSPLLQLGCQNIKYLKIYDIDIKDDDNIHLGSKNKLDLPLNYAYRTAASQTHKQKLLVDKEINCNIGRSKDEMNKEYMKKLMDVLLTRTVCKSELTKTFNTKPEMLSRSPKINPVKSSCEALKASFLDLRRVSDHTVLVRWRIPSELEHVQGYELQVDGRAVQKILSPTRCMAILTCLPNCEKLLLTIRTLTITVLPSGHYPAATVVYCPREKRSLGRTSLKSCVKVNQCEKI